MTLPEFEIDVQIDSAYTGQVSEEGLTRAATVALDYQSVREPTGLSIVVTGDGMLRRLNRTYRGVDAPTDVLAFGSADDPFASGYLGDVVISFPQAEAQARRAGHPLEAEFQLLVVHGVLHLLGHDHAEPDPSGKAEMWSAQAAILRELGLSTTDSTDFTDGA